MCEFMQWKVREGASSFIPEWMTLSWVLADNTVGRWRNIWKNIPCWTNSIGKRRLFRQSFSCILENKIEHQLKMLKYKAKFEECGMRLVWQQVHYWEHGDVLERGGRDWMDHLSKMSESENGSISCNGDMYSVNFLFNFLFLVQVSY